MVIGDVNNELNATHPMYNIPAKSVWAADQHFRRHNYDLYTDDNTIPSNGASPDFWAELDERKSSSVHASSSERRVDNNDGNKNTDTDLSDEVVAESTANETSDRASSVATTTDGSSSDITSASGTS